MATRSIEILSGMTKPGLSDECYFIPLRAVTGISAIADHMLVAFDATGQEEKLETLFYIPDEYVGTPVITTYWFSDASAGETFAWRYRWTAVGDGDPVDAAFTVTQNGTAHTTAGQFVCEVSAEALTVDSTFVAGKLCQFNLIRRGNVSSDTQNGTMYLMAARFSYADQ